MVNKDMEERQRKGFANNRLIGRITTGQITKINHQLGDYEIILLIAYFKRFEIAKEEKG